MELFLGSDYPTELQFMRLVSMSRFDTALCLYHDFFDISVPKINNNATSLGALA